jgi:hypothetical protein
MLHVTEAMLVLGKQPQKLFTDYNVPAVKVADIIYKATEEITKRHNYILNDHQDTKGEPGYLTKNQVFFTYPLGEARLAIGHVGEGHARGKIVITV